MKVKNMFYNFTFNYLSPTGQSKFCWGIGDFDLSKSLIPQLLAVTEFRESEVFNLNLTAFNSATLCQDGEEK